MRQASLIDVIEFILRQNGGPTSAEDIHHRLSELEILEKRSGVGPIDILYRAKAEPAVFVIDDQDRIWLTKEQLTDLAPLFRKRLWQLRDTMRAFPEPGIDLTMAVLAYAIVAKKPEESPELWAKGRFEGECLQQVIERIAKRFPVGMGPVVDYIRNTSWEYHLDIDHWLLFAELVKPDPLEVIKVMREFGNASPTGGFTVPWPIASLMGSLLGDGMIEDLLDMTVDAGALPVVVTGRGGNVGRLTGYYSDPVGSMLAQLELDLVGLTVRSEPFTASLLDDREYDRILAVPPMGRMRNPFPLGGKTTDAPTIYLERLLGLLQATGRAVVMVPVNVLFSSSTPIKRLREALVHADHLDAVIELPQGVLRPYAGVNTAILVIDKYKPIERRGKVFMLRAKLDDAGGRSTTSLDQALVKAGALSKSRLEEAGISQVITGRSIELRTFDLTPAKYLDSLREISITSRSPEGHLVTLDEVIVRQRFQSVRVGDSPKLNALPNAPMFVRVSDLAKDPSYPFLRMRSTEKIKGTVKLIDRDAILVSQAFNRLSPTLFRFKDRAVALGQHVMALVPDTSRVLPDYLVRELAQPYVQQQIKAISRGVTIQRFTEADLRGIVIQLIPKAEQRKVVAERRDWTGLIHKVKASNTSLQKETITELIELLRSNGLEGDDEAMSELFVAIAQSEQRSISDSLREEVSENLGFLAHNFNNKLRRVQGALRSMSKYLERKAKSGEPFQFTDPIRLPLAGQEIQPALVKDVLSSLVNGTEEMSDLIDEEIKLFRASGDQGFVEVTKVLRQVTASHAGQEGYSIHLHLGEEMSDAFGNEHRLREVIDNIFSNAVRHGFEGGAANHIEVEVLFVGEDSLQILIGNDGTPPTLPFGEMIKKGVRASASKGTGNGLYMADRWVREMGGHMFDATELLSSFRRPITFAVGIELKQPVS